MLFYNKCTEWKGIHSKDKKNNKTETKHFGCSKITFQFPLHHHSNSQFFLVV